MTKKNFLGVFGHVALDTICSVRRFPKPNTCEAVLARRIEYGGTAGNLAIFAASLGVKTALGSFVGDDFPPAYRNKLEKAGIDLTNLIEVKGERTSSIIMVSDGLHQQIGYVDQGVMLKQDRMKLLSHAIDSARIVHVGTGRPGYARKICKYANENGKVVAFDPAQEIHYVYDAVEFSKVIRQAHIFFCNESELKVALDYLDMNKPEDLLGVVDTVIITLGKRGSRILQDGQDEINIPPCKPKRIVDTTGAGDAYRAGFYAGLDHGFGMEKCGVIASAAASFAVENFGGQTNPPSREDVWKRAFGGSTA